MSTGIVVFDHNCDRPDYALAVYNDPEAAKYVTGAAFHHYRGDLSAMSYVHEARPDKEIYFTEQMTTERPGQRQIAIAPAVERLIVGIMRNWSRNVVLWNLAADPLNDPHTDNGGCSMCQGALTIDKDSVSRNLAYYVIAHASKFVRPGSVRHRLDRSRRQERFHLRRRAAAQCIPHERHRACRRGCQRGVPHPRRANRARCSQ